MNGLVIIIIIAVAVVVIIFLLFCLTIHHLTTQLESQFCVVYLDDGSLGGDYKGCLEI